MADDRQRDDRSDKPARQPREKPGQRPGEGFEHRPAPQGRKIMERDRKDRRNERERDSDER